MKHARFMMLLILGLACLWGASRVHRSLLGWRTGQGGEAAISLDRSPPLVVFTAVALGGFRGIIADALWIRLLRLQDEKKVFEMVQLSDWIAKLDPRFPRIWAFNAWNLAYNISVHFPDPEDRWRWVSAGIRLLRDEGLKYNPRSAALHWELGWMYQHKLGHFLDPAHRLYQWKLAQEMAGLFDGPRPAYRAAPRDSRLRRMQEEYKLDPALMERIDLEYGPLDWRLPATHAVYWACRGLRVAGPGEDTFECEIMLCRCMAESFRHGRLTLDPRAGLYLATPELDLLPRVLRAYEEALRRHPHDETLKFSYVNFLDEAATILFAYGRVAAARGLHERLCRLLPESTPPDFESFLLDNLRVGVEATPFRDAPALVDGFLVRHYLAAARGDEECAAAWERLARAIYERLLEAYPEAAVWERAGLAPVEAMRRQAFWRAVAESPDVAAAVRLMALTPAEDYD